MKKHLVLILPIAFLFALGSYQNCAPTGSAGAFNLNSGSGNNPSPTPVTSPTPVPSPTPTPTPVPTQMMGMGGFNSCAINSSGGAECWGYNVDGQIGNGTVTQENVPVAVSGLSSGVAMITGGFYSTCAINSASGVECWGDNVDGQLGNNTTTNSSVPVAVSGLGSGVAKIVSGAYHTCALTTGGAVYCWGYNIYGQIGNGTTTNALVPTLVSGLSSGVTSIAAGFYHTCAIVSGGSIKCWGYNVDGQIGNGTTTNALTPATISGITTAVKMGNGYAHSCAVLSSGAVQCWGYNAEGQLGNNTLTNSSVPVSVLGLSGATMTIAGGSEHTCALSVSGAVQCWGDNVDGQLGNNTTTNSSLPVNVVNLGSGVAEISLGSVHSCARLSTGSAECWGYGLYGQIGDGATTNALIPALVSGITL